MNGMRTEDVVIVGGGLAGAATACILASAGRPTRLIERDREPRHKVCGEFLSIEAQDYLAHLGLDLDGLGASRISHLRLFQNRAIAEIELPFLARGLSRRILDDALLQQARSRGATVTRGTPVRSIRSDGAHIRLDMEGHIDVSARTLFLATGKHDVRGMKRQAGGAMNDLIGFKMHYRLEQERRHALEGSVEVLLFAGGYAGLQMIEQGVANLCLVVTQMCFERVGKNWSDLLDHIARECPHLAGRLQAAQPLLERPLSIFQIPYGFLHAPDAGEPQGLFRLGDQAGVIPSFTGEGMSMALHSGCLAAATFLSHGNASSLFHRRMQDDTRRQIRVASALNNAIRHAAGRNAIFHLCRIWPAAMRHVTRLTRMEASSMSRAFVAS